MKTVFAIDAYGDRDPATNAEKLVIKVVRSPVEVPEAERTRDFDFSLAGLPRIGEPQAVMERGRRLRASLAQHPGVAQVLDAIEKTPKGETKPIYVALRGTSAELIGWESLCDVKDDFFALDSRWPVGRIADPSSGSERLPGRLELPIRLMVIISAYGIQGQEKEWEAFEASLQVASKQGLDWRVKVLVGNSALHARVTTSIEAGLAGVEVAYVDATPSRLSQTILAYDPQVLHFFCHGRSDAVDQSLELATAGDYADPTATGGSLRLTKANLGYFATELSNPWLLTLNCCSGGQAVSNLNSLAFDAVAVRFPAAVAMLEPLDAKIAHEFTSSFYRALFKTLASARTQLGAAPRAAFEWGQAMFDARAAIKDIQGGEAQTRHEWTIPALYVRGVDPFYFEKPPAVAPVSKDEDTDYRGRTRIMADWLRTAGSQLDEAERAEVLAKVLAGVPKQYWPNLDGEFADVQ